MIPGQSPLPWLLPGTAIACVVSLVAGDRVGRWLGVRRTVAGILILGFGMIVAGTLTPNRSGLDHGTVGSATCDLTRMSLASPADLLKFYDAGVNILLFIPLGVAIGLAPRSPRRAALVISAVVLPFVIEMTQLLVPQLDRACESADVVDNLTGLAIGFGSGVVVGQLAGARTRRPQ